LGTTTVLSKPSKNYVFGALEALETLFVGSVSPCGLRNVTKHCNKRVTGNLYKKTYLFAINATFTFHFNTVDIELQQIKKKY
jgi:hypothetical protein